MDLEYDSKKIHKKGRRVYKNEENLHKAQMRNMFMEKNIEDPLQELSKERQKALMNDDSDGMLHGVRYSVNKHGRWKMSNAETILPGKQRKDVNVVFIDHAYALFAHNNMATSVSILNDDGSVATARQKRHTCQKPRIEYIVHTVNPDPTKLRRMLIIRAKFWSWSTRKTAKLGATNEQYLEERDYCECGRCRWQDACPWRRDSEEEEEREKKEGKKREGLSLVECIRHPTTNKTKREEQRRGHIAEEDDYVFV